MASNILHKSVRWLGLVCLIEAGLLHYLASEAAYLRAPYLGYAFVANFFVMLIAALGVYFRRAWGWYLGAFLSLGSLLAYAWDSLIGLPQLAVRPWLYPFLLVAGVLEVLFLLLSFFRPWKLAEQPWHSPFRRHAFMPSILIFVGLLALPTYQWDIFASEVGYHHHVGSLSSVCSTPLTSFNELEQKYGIQVSLVAISMMDGIVDVRLKILDPDKANTLLVDQAALLVDQQFLVLAPHVHQHFRLKRDKIHFIFFPTQNNTIHSGSQVSLVFGAVRVEPVTVR